MSGVNRFVARYASLWGTLALCTISGAVIVIPIFWVAGIGYEDLQRKMILMSPFFLVMIALHFYAQHLNKDKDGK